MTLLRGHFLLHKNFIFRKVTLAYFKWKSKENNQIALVLFFSFDIDDPKLQIKTKVQIIKEDFLLTQSFQKLLDSQQLFIGSYYNEMYLLTKQVWFLNFWRDFTLSAMTNEIPISEKSSGLILEESMKFFPSYVVTVQTTLW